MRNVKLGTCFAAAAITLAGSTYLANPASASALMTPCSSGEAAFADGYAAGYCSANGYQGGTITSCESNGDGTITISGTCN